MRKCEFERKIGRRTYRVLGEAKEGKVMIRVYVETPAKLKGQEVHSSFFFASEWLEFQSYAGALLRGVG